VHTEPTDFKLRQYELTFPEGTPMSEVREDQTEPSRNFRWKIILAGVVALALVVVLIPLWLLRF
jgi:hypothetical protein